MRTREMEMYIQKYFMENNTYLAVIPRVFKKFKIHECDLIVVTKREHIYEIEIKVSVQDCKKDKQKEHKHIDIYNRLKYQYFAVPKSIVKQCEPHIEEKFGIIVVDDTEEEHLRGNIHIHRPAPLNPTYRKITKGELINLLTTGCNRYFKLIENNLDYFSEDKEEDEEIDE